jgi:AraC-like DNA-binding protein
MIIRSKSALELAENQMELVSGRDHSFPYTCTFDESRNFLDRGAPWHWHNQLEIDFVTRGTVHTRTTDTSYDQKAGEILFLNKGTLHTVQFPEESEYYVHQFDSSFLSGNFGGAIEQTYFSPLLRSEAAASLLITPDTAGYAEMTEALWQAVFAMQSEPFGYELIAREALSRFWLVFIQATKSLWEDGSPVSSPDTPRIKAMIQYIYSHYNESVALEDIASAAKIGVRECSRCFRRCLGTSPVQFLIQHRLQVSAKMLLTTAKPISEIAWSCGFPSESYFGRMFRKQFECTPGEFRKKA